jgi:hypothetical protein
MLQWQQDDQMLGLTICLISSRVGDYVYLDC